MKRNKLKIITIILLIILIAMVAFVGVYVQVQNRMENNVEGYEYAMDISGSRKVVLKLSEETEEVVKDSEGNVIEDATDDEITENGYTTEEVSVNDAESLTAENYNKAKEIIENRLDKLSAGNYRVGVNEETGEIQVELTENDETDSIVSNLTTIGKFEIVDTETEEVLLTNDDIKTSNVQRSSTTSGTSIYLTIEFNNEGKQKLEEITNTYVPQSSDDTDSADEETEETSDETTEETTDTEETTEDAETSEETESTEEDTSDDTDSSESETTEKTITMKIDDEEVMSTSFDEPITDGIMYLTVGSSTTDSSTLQDNIDSALQMATVLSFSSLPLEYETSTNTYIQSSITRETLDTIKTVVAIIGAVAFVIVIFKYKSNGILATFAYVGMASLFLLVIRYANVVLSIEGIVAVIAILLINYIYTIKILRSLKKIKEDKKADSKHTINLAIKDISVKLIPLYILAIVFCFAGWVPSSSFGMVMFWGVTLAVLYNLTITKSLLKYSVNK